MNVMRCLLLTSTINTWLDSMRGAINGQMGGVIRGLFRSALTTVSLTLLRLPSKIHRGDLFPVRHDDD
jgi:hypothetical protein